MNKLNVPERMRPLDPNSEVIALSTYGNTKNLLVTAVELRGPFDEDAMEKAAKMASKEFPALTCRLRQIRHGLTWRLYWEPRPDDEFPVIRSDLMEKAPGVSPLDAFLDHVAHRLDRDWDLFRELPGEFHIARLAEDHYLTGPVVHHAVADADTASQFGRRIIYLYEELTTGRKTELPPDNRSVSTSNKRRAARRKRSLWEDLAFSARFLSVGMRRKPALPTGGGRHGDKAQHQVKRVLTEEQTAVLLNASRGTLTSFIDRLVAAANVAIEDWNRRKGTPAGIVTTAVTVNLSGRYSGVGGANKASVLFFVSTPDERRDSADLTRSIARKRFRQFRDQTDLKLYESLAKMARTFRMLPFGIRRRVFHYFAQRQEYSIGVTLLGVVWPVLADGKPTGESSPIITGEAQITEVHGVGYKLQSGTRTVLIVYLFRNRLNFIMAVSADLLARSEAEQFMDVIMDNLLANSE